MRAIFYSILLVSAFTSCIHESPTQKTTSQTAIVALRSRQNSVDPKAKKDTSKEKVLTLTAMFVDFARGDAAHFLFEDKSGKGWNFFSCEAKDFTFAETLPESEFTAENQGVGANKALQKKWFDLKYVYRKQPLYTDGPIAKVPIIIDAKMRK